MDRRQVILIGGNSEGCQCIGAAGQKIWPESVLQNE